MGWINTFLNKFRTRRLLRKVINKDFILHKHKIHSNGSVSAKQVFIHSLKPYMVSKIPIDFKKIDTLYTSGLIKAKINNLNTIIWNGNYNISITSLPTANVYICISCNDVYDIHEVFTETHTPKVYLPYLSDISNIDYQMSKNISLLNHEFEVEDFAEKNYIQFDFTQEEFSNFKREYIGIEVYAEDIIKYKKTAL